MARTLLQAWAGGHLVRGLVIAVAWFFAPPALGQEAAPEDLVVEAMGANPTLSSTRARADAMASRAEVAGAWPDPMLAVEYSNVPTTSFGLSDHPMAGLQLKVQQGLRPPGWGRLQRDVGDLRAEAMDHGARESELAVARMIRQGWWLLTRTRMLEAVTREHLERTEELLAAARVRYETGTLGQHAVLRLEVLRDRLTDELGEFAKADTELSAMLDEALARTSPSSFDTPAAAVPLAPPDNADWMELAEAHRPLLARLEAERAAHERAAKLARVDALPDPSVWAGYRIRTVQTEMDPGTDLVSIGLGVPLPTGSGRRAGGQRRAALEEARASASQQDAALDRIRAEMAAILARWSRAWTKTKTYDETLIPGARATLETTQADFSVGRADFASLFEAEVALLDLERARIAAAVETHLQHAEATAVLGTPPPGADE